MFSPFLIIPALIIGLISGFYMIICYNVISNKWEMLNPFWMFNSDAFDRDTDKYRRKFLLFFLLSMTLGILSIVFSPRIEQCNLSIHGNRNLIGATVYINGIEKGKFKKFGNTASDFGTFIPSGKHSVIVKLDSKVICEETFTVKEDASEHYLYCDEAE